MLIPMFSFAGCLSCESILQAAKPVLIERPTSWRKQACSTSGAMPNFEDAI